MNHVLRSYYAAFRRTIKVIIIIIIIITCIITFRIFTRSYRTWNNEQCDQLRAVMCDKLNWTLVHTRAVNLLGIVSHSTNAHIAAFQPPEDTNRSKKNDDLVITTIQGGPKKVSPYQFIIKSY